VLLINLNSVLTEIAKNLILAGINIDISDSEDTDTDTDTDTDFINSPKAKDNTDIIINPISEINPKLSKLPKLKVVTEKDCNNNFFINIKDIGQIRAEVIKRKFTQINSLVSINIISNLGNNNNTNQMSEIIKSYDLVLYGLDNYNLSHAYKLEDICQLIQIPFSVVKCHGYYGFFYLTSYFYNTTVNKDKDKEM